MTEEQLENGRPDPPLAGTEIETLLGFLAYQRATFAWKCSGLDDAQLRARLHPTAMTLGGLLMHLARVEDNWFSAVVAEAPNPEPWASMPWAAEWNSAGAHTGDELRQMWMHRVEASSRVVAAQLEAGESALDTTHLAWGGEGQPSLRWVLVHMIEEYARHNGHADFLRESIDGETGE
ncbi:MAG: DinB family protein [Mycobacteriales bacterium]